MFDEFVTPNSEYVVAAAGPSIVDKINQCDVKQNTISEDLFVPMTDIKINEILISNNQHLEQQVHDLQANLAQLESKNEAVINEFKNCSQKVIDLEKELQNINHKYLYSTQELMRKDSIINELISAKSSLVEENNNLLEQLEFTKSILNSKETEIDSLNTRVYNVQNQYDVLQLQFQQLTNGIPTSPPHQQSVELHKNEELLQKIASLEQQINLSQKEKDQLNLHYQHYVAELNEQLKIAFNKNEGLNKEIQTLACRENSLIEQISDMEIRIQNFHKDKKLFEMDQNTSNIKTLQENLQQLKDNLKELEIKHKQLQSQYAESEGRVKELSELKEVGCTHENISMSKLSADMTSDKVAAQRATEQNKKLKQDIQGLEDAFVKMSKDKLELTEKLTAEKYLNRELTIKLAEVDEKAKEMQIKLKAKDEEMIRLQSNFRDIEKQCAHLKETENNINIQIEDSHKVREQTTEIISENNNIIVSEHDVESEKPLITETVAKKCLQREDAMSKLQERFLKIMEEVADLSDEKHRLEHIILQLQNETDTICEYVALYQQQRSLLKRRDEERTAQLKVFQQECGKLKCQLEELSGILIRFADDSELLTYFQIESRRSDMEKVMSLLTNLKNNYLIDPNKTNVEFKNFYPCNCCSGKLIDV